MDTGVELVGVKNGIGLFYDYSAGKESVNAKEIPLVTFIDKEYACRNFKSTGNEITLNGIKFNSIKAMLAYTDSLFEADLKSSEHTRNGWYFF